MTNGRHPMTRIATIDVGTNTALLLVADVGEGRLEIVREADRYVRLGQGVDANRRLAPEAVARVVAALTDYKAVADELGAEAVVIGATSASRDAQNLDDLQGQARRLGLDYRVISGEEEALWSFRAACSAYPGLEAACVIDIGGGSTEVVTGPADAAEPHRRSVDMGSVRLTERCFPTLPPSAEAVEAAEEIVAEAFGGLGVDASLPLVGSSGTVRVLGALAQAEDPTAPVTAETVPGVAGPPPRAVRRRGAGARPGPARRAGRCLCRWGTDPRRVHAALRVRVGEAEPARAAPRPRAAVDGRGSVRTAQSRNPPLLPP